MILLVVLGGGAALLAVVLTDQRASWAPHDRHGTPSLRGDGGGHTAPRGTAVDERAPRRTARRSATVPPTPVDEAATSSVPPSGTAARPRLRGPVVVATGAVTAVEGAYRDVAEVPFWRRVVSLVLLVVIVGLLSVGVTVALAATVALVAELLDRAIG